MVTITPVVQEILPACSGIEDCRAARLEDAAQIRQVMTRNHRVQVVHEGWDVAPGRCVVPTKVTYEGRNREVEVQEGSKE